MISIDVIGTIYTPGTYDTEGNALTEPVAQLGFHVNTTQSVPHWSAYEVKPSTPRRVFGGTRTYFYTFTSEANYIATGLIQQNKE
jgi:hypothetical protein